MEVKGFKEVILVFKEIDCGYVIWVKIWVINWVVKWVVSVLVCSVVVLVVVGDN